MYRIVASIISLQQHLDSLANNPIIYRPRVCPHCSFGQLWCHGCYERKADRQASASDSLNPIPIPRYLLPGLSSDLFPFAGMHCSPSLV